MNLTSSCLLILSFLFYFRSKFATMTRSSSHDSIMDALSGSPKSEDTPESKLEKEVLFGHKVIKLFLMLS